MHELIVHDTAEWRAETSDVVRFLLPSRRRTRREGRNHGRFIQIAGPGAIAEVLHQTLERCDINAAELARCISAGESTAQLAREHDALEALQWKIDGLDLVWKLGAAGATLGLAALLAAIEEGAPTLVYAGDESGFCALVVQPIGDAAR